MTGASGWSAAPVWAIFRSREEFGGTGQLLSLSATHGIRARVEGEGRAASDDLSAYRRVRPGDIVINKLVAQDGAIAVSTLNGKVSPAYWVLVPDARFDARFLNYLLNSSPVLAEIARRSKFMPPAQFDLPWDQFRTMRLAAPALEQQRAIADYLDAETARIDALIAKKQRLAELLDERFLARGRLLVTGGAPADGWSPSQTWAGPVPSSWRPLKIASFARLGSGTTPASDVDAYYSDEGVAWVTTAELREALIRGTSRSVTDRALRDYSALKVFPAGTVLVAMYGATVGRVGMLGIPATTNQACCAIYDATDLDLRFVYWWLILNRENLLDMAYGAGQPNISQETVRSLRVPAPTLTEQRAIAECLDAEARRLEELISVLSLQIDLLREHRQALITAAVTGELEIPGVVG